MKYGVGIFFLLIIWSFGLAVHEKPKQWTEEELGAELFFDTKLSLDQSISCASCHNPQFAFADSVAFSSGVNGAKGERNTPSVMNMLSRPYFFFDGRSATLEAQASEPVKNPVEMHLPFDLAVQRIAQDTFYQRVFQTVYQQAPDSVHIVQAIAAFERSLESDGSSPYDLWMNDEDTTQFSYAAQRGRELFIEKARCFDCHFSPDFTGDEFRNIGLYDEVSFKDKGRFDISGDSVDLGAFKVPGLRNVALTAPYMHNGMFQTLEEVVEYYDDPRKFVANPINLDTSLAQPLHLSVQEKKDLVVFLESLTDKQIPYRER